MKISIRNRTRPLHVRCRRNDGDVRHRRQEPPHPGPNHAVAEIAHGERAQNGRKGALEKCNVVVGWVT